MASGPVNDIGVGDTVSTSLGFKYRVVALNQLSGQQYAILDAIHCAIMLLRNNLNIVKKFTWEEVTPTKPGHYWLLLTRWEVAEVGYVNGKLALIKDRQRVGSVHPTRWGGEFK